MEGRRSAAGSRCASVSNQPAGRGVARQPRLCDPGRMPMSKLPCLALLLSVAACHLVDQRDFNPKAGLRPVPAVAAVRPVPPIPALVTIAYTTPDPDYREALTDAVHKVLARKPDAGFLVATTLPSAPGADGTAARAEDEAAAGREVAQTIVDAGADPGQIEQVISTDPSATARTVRVTLR